MAGTAGQETRRRFKPKPTLKIQPTQLSAARRQQTLRFVSKRLQTLGKFRCTAAWVNALAWLHYREGSAVLLDWGSFRQEPDAQHDRRHLRRCRCDGPDRQLLRDLVMRFPALVFALLALPVLAWAGGASASPACPFAATAASDGCAGANWSSVSFQRSNFFSYARQSGQTYAGPYPDHPPQYNVAGVDYPVGFYTPTERLVDPSIKAPTNCAYHSSGSHMSGGAYLVCPTSNVGSGQTLHDLRLGLRPAEWPRLH